MTPIITKNLGPNSVTELEEVLKVWEVNISAKIELITVVYEIVTLAPNGSEIKTSGPLAYGRYNSETNQAFDYFRNSPIGQGIMQAINGTLQYYPNLEQS